MTDEADDGADPVLLASDDGKPPAKRESYGQMGTAMRQLNERQRAFVRAYVVHPPGPGALVNSYIAAGYGLPDSKRSTVAKNAHHLSRDEKVIAAVREEAVKLLRLGHPEAVNVFVRGDA